MSILNTCSGKRFLCLAGLLQASLLSAGNLFFNSGAEMGTAGFALWRLMNPIILFVRSWKNSPNGLSMRREYFP